jgi:hypothetical protein
MTCHTLYDDTPCTSSCVMFSMAFIIAALRGDVGGIVSNSLHAVYILQPLSYNRHAEDQANAQGVQLG